MRNFFLPLLAAFAASVAKADPTPPGYEYLYTVNATLLPAIEIGDGPVGNRVAIPIIGGEFHGPKLNGKLPFLLSLSAPATLNSRRTDCASDQPTDPGGRVGKVLNLGADWGLTDKFGTFHPDTRYHFQTNDGANIFIRTSGPAQKDQSIHLHVLFETGHPDYYWLNNVVAVGVLKAGDNYVVIDTWRITTPVGF